LAAVIELNVSIEGTAQLFLANAKIMGRMLLWKIFHTICIATDMIRVLTKSRHHGVEVRVQKGYGFNSCNNKVRWQQCC